MLLHYFGQLDAIPRPDLDLFNILFVRLLSKFHRMVCFGMGYSARSREMGSFSSRRVEAFTGNQNIRLTCCSSLSSISPVLVVVFTYLEIHIS